MGKLDFGQRYVYRGSLTTPPYTESMLWTVLQPLTITEQTRKYFQTKVGYTNRDIQPRNQRNVYKLSISESTTELREMIKDEDYGDLTLSLVQKLVERY